MDCVSICRILPTQQTLVHRAVCHLTGRSPTVAWFRTLSTQQAQNQIRMNLFPSSEVPYRLFHEDRPSDRHNIGKFGNNPAQQPTCRADLKRSRSFTYPPDNCLTFSEPVPEDVEIMGNLSMAFIRGSFPPPDFVFYVDGRHIEAHRVILSVRSSYFKHKFQTDWKDLTCFTFSKDDLSYNALSTLVNFFYSEWVDTALDDLQDLATISQIFRCESLSKFINNQLSTGISEEYTHIMIHASVLPVEDRLPASLYRVLQFSLANSMIVDSVTSENVHDLADICVKVDEKIFRCHQVVLATRSEYFKKRIRKMHYFQRNDGFHLNALPCLEEPDLSPAIFENMLEFMYTGSLKDIGPKQAEELLDAFLRYLLFPRYGVLVTLLLPHVEMASPAEIWDWLLLAVVYELLEIREYCLDSIAHNFETYADTREFRAILLTLRNTAPSPFEVEGNIYRTTIFDDLRERWLQVKYAELDQSSENEKAVYFDKNLQRLMQLAE